MTAGAPVQQKNLRVAARSQAATRRRRSRVTKRTRRTSDDVTNRIVAAARRQFERAGFDGTTTAAIARKAQVTEAQLFRCFGSKSNLFRETIFKPLERQLLSFVNRHMPDPQRPAEYREAV